MAKTNSHHHTQKIKLSIQVSLNGLSFCALDPADQKIVFFKDRKFKKKLNPMEILEQIENLYEQEVFLREGAHELHVQFSSELYSLVPRQLFQEEAASDYLKYNAKILETDFVAQDVLEEFDIVNVFIPYTNINNYFFDRYGEFEYRHTVSVLTEELLKLNKEQQEGTKVYLHCNSFGFDLLVVQEGKLLLANSFLCNTPEDFIYYLLFTVEQLELDPLKIDLILLGKIEEESEYYKMAYTYIKHIEFLETSFGYIFDAPRKAPKGYQYYPLLKSVQ